MSIVPAIAGETPLNHASTLVAMLERMLSCSLCRDSGFRFSRIQLLTSNQASQRHLGSLRITSSSTAFHDGSRRGSTKMNLASHIVSRMEYPFVLKPLSAQPFLDSIQ